MVKLLKTTNLDKFGDGVSPGRRVVPRRLGRHGDESGAIQPERAIVGILKRRQRGLVRLGVDSRAEFTFYSLELDFHQIGQFADDENRPVLRVGGSQCLREFNLHIRHFAIYSNDIEGRN